MMQGQKNMKSDRNIQTQNKKVQY